MADTQAPGDTSRPSGSMTVDTGVDPARGGTVTTTRKGEATFQEERSAASVTVGGDERDVRPGFEEGGDTDGLGAGGEASETQEDAAAGSEDRSEGSQDGEGQAPEDLGDYLPDDPEVAAKFDQRYFTEEGKLNTSALETEWFTQRGEGAPRSLNEGTYKYLEERLGLSRELVDGYGQGLEAMQEKRDTEFFAGAGGKERYTAAVEWARAGGYTKEQKERFNAMLAKGGQDAEDARDALMGRFSKANNKAQRDARKTPLGVPERRPANAAKDVTARGGRGGDGVQPFANRDESTKAFRAAKGDDAKMAVWRKRLAASPDHVRS